MKVLWIHELTGRSIINLANVVRIEFESNAQHPALYFTTTADTIPIRIGLAAGVYAEDVWALLGTALKPLYEGRSLETHGVSMDLDVRGLQFGMALNDD
jgi:hypothetical protein